MGRTLSVAFTVEQFELLEAWKERYANSLGIAPEKMTWPIILLAYANSMRLP